MEWFIPLYRKIKEWGWYKSWPTKDLFIHILLSVNYKTWYWQWIEILPWQMVTWRKVLALELWLWEQQIRTALNNLLLTWEITIKSTKKYSILTLANWELYNQQVTNSQPTGNQQVTTNNKNNNTIREKDNKGTTETIIATQPKNSEYEKSINFLREISEHIFDPVIETPDYAISHDIQWRSFLAHFIEKDKSGKMRAEREKTFDLKLRFLKWLSNGYGSKNAPKPQKTQWFT